ncbi:MAG: hypothetical protein FD123_2310 [Bacteroidetes bacterium]|nr:MAG: hypothetical protein FD123_2310 [Bacteroidota bacterium]
MIPLFLEPGGNSSGDDYIILILLAQLFVGFFQLVIALAFTIDRLVRKKPMPGLRIYWIAVAVYFSVLIAMQALSLALFDTYMPEEILGAWFFSAWLIALYMPFFGLVDKYYAQKSNQQLPIVQHQTLNVKH